ncbi:TMEM175 family protein [Mucilaginibacter sp.]|uniref:TMEM175 family protein n=1 Tax=Mucilaginibacter sp. TaxID=1882438 RepID=UPI003B00034C
MQSPESLIEEEVKQEFQLERMILFSDAVFAIVITLMAIDIKIPDTNGIRITSAELTHHLLHLLPIFIAYAFSFFFIGRTWYDHLKLFGYLKKYDGGLVFCNLLLLFSIGLFPFAASVLVHLVKTSLNFAIYFAILGLCFASEIYLRYYVLIKHPELRNDKPIHIELLTYHLQKNIALVFVVTFLFVFITNLLITGLEDKQLALLWSLPALVMIRLLRSKYNKSRRQMLKTS